MLTNLLVNSSNVGSKELFRIMSGFKVTLKSPHILIAPLGLPTFTVGVAQLIGV